MFAYKDACHISGLIPFGFIGHVIINHFTVYLQVFKTNVFLSGEGNNILIAVAGFGACIYVMHISLEQLKV